MNARPEKASNSLRGPGADDEDDCCIMSPERSYKRPSSHSFESELSLSARSSLDECSPPRAPEESTQPPRAAPVALPSEASAVRQPLPDSHASFLQKALKKLRPGMQLPARQVRQLGKGGVGEVDLLELQVPGADPASAPAPLLLARKAIHCKKYDAARHEREVAAMQAAAGCPFVLRVYGSSQPGRPPYALFLEYAPLGSLHQLIEARRRAARGRAPLNTPLFDEQEVRWVGARVLAALAHLHARGLVHRDVSAHNIYRAASGHPLLADFDAAAAVDAEGYVYGAAVRQVYGRLAAAAPEVRAAAYGGGEYGTRADVWSLGSVLLGMVSEEEVADGPELRGCSEELRDLLLRGLLVPQAKRLDAAAAMRHPFFAGVEWSRLEYEEAPPGLRG